MTTDQIIAQWEAQQRERAMLEHVRSEANAELWRQVWASTAKTGEPK